MGWFSRFSEPKVPRWGFRTGWDDFVRALHEEAQAYALSFDDAQLADGMIALPDGAVYEAWDVRSLATRCRDLEPHEWLGQIRASLHHAYGRDGDLEIVASAPPTARAAGRTVTTSPPTTLHERLRVQIFGRAYIAATGLSPNHVAMRPFGDAWLVVVEDVAGAAEATVRWADLHAASIGRDAAFELGRENGVRDTSPHMEVKSLSTTGASVDLVVANSFYLGAVMLEAHTRMPADAAIVVCALTWHHWAVATLERGVATRATLNAIADLVGNLDANVSVATSEVIGTSLWWWPVGAEPVVFDPRGMLPSALAGIVAAAPS